jgi:murein L,D-transpeptidase YafK
MRTVILLTMSVVALGAPAHAGPFEKSQRQYPRVRAAFEAHLEGVRAEFEQAGADWPPHGVFLRAFKHEGVLELWAEPEEEGARVLVRSIPICAQSGVLGPKRRSGDLQVPEGFYAIDRFNPRSNYHLSVGVDYPNAVDKARAGDDPPGGDIFIHGNCVTIGCLPIEDGPIEALYVALVSARDQGQKHIPVHLFPCRFGTAECQAATAEADAELAAFWGFLAIGFAEFELTHVPPVFKATAKGYVRTGP